MRVKFLTAFFLFSLLILKASAQNSVTLNINLHPIQTLVINPSQDEVTLNYTTKEHYKSGVTSEQADHLTIYSTSGFQIRVISNEPLGKKLPSNSIAIIPSSGSKPITQSSIVYLKKNLSDQEEPIITSTTGGIDRNFNISYKGAGANMYIDYSDASDTATTYTYNVMYTIVSQ
ncbi:hypothetical protein [Myroides indicus]|uniref:Uncharacterized protein n=1 Tax=Myroides indicus TaxID=1323422 RepID=A0A4R7F446_9FLAO|nr:hypothetical protein [Myroides indicus]TDS65302.1 hypothetical protein C8P70_10286 [Myroides indicus]